jgi:hypothetical protein
MFIDRNITVSLIQYPVQSVSYELLRWIYSISIVPVEAFLWRNDQYVKRVAMQSLPNIVYTLESFPLLRIFHFSGSQKVCEIDCGISERFGVAMKQF